MRVMLMVQNDPQRPRSARIKPHASVVLQGAPAMVEWAERRVGDLRRNPDRWWLVEAESAEAAREAIRHSGGGACDRPPGHECAVVCEAGRILASGGRS